MTTTVTAKNSVAKNEPKLGEVEQLKLALAAAQAETATARAEVERVRSARGVSTMQVIRKTLAGKTTATVAEIRDACKAAGVPARSDVTIKTIMSDFRQTYEALKRAGRIAS